jgi:hypothetical protein
LIEVWVYFLGYIMFMKIVNDLGEK